MYRRLMVFVVILMVAPLVQGAVISGIVYDDSLSVQKDVILDIDTTPKQQYIAKNGTYRFNVPEGSYVIRARYTEYGTLIASDQSNITVKEAGEFTLDFILFPEFGEEAILEDVESVDLDVDLDGEPRNDVLKIALYILLVVLVAFVVYLWRRKKGGKQEKQGSVKPESAESDESLTKEKLDEEDDLKQYIDFIKKHKRVTQKEIRKEFPLSEAKISLIITELESKGIVKKIKKGRGNVIIYSG